MATAIVQLYLLCFAYHRFRQINDNLIEAFIHLVDQYETAAKLSAQAAAQQALIAASSNLNAAGRVLNLFIDTSIPDNAPFAVVKEQAFSFLEPEGFPLVMNYMRSIAFDKDRLGVVLLREVVTCFQAESPASVYRLSVLRPSRGRAPTRSRHVSAGVAARGQSPA